MERHHAQILNPKLSILVIILQIVSIGCQKHSGLDPLSQTRQVSIAFDTDPPAEKGLRQAKYDLDDQTKAGLVALSGCQVASLEEKHGSYIYLAAT